MKLIDLVLFACFFCAINGDSVHRTLVPIPPDIQKKLDDIEHLCHLLKTYHIEPPIHFSGGLFKVHCGAKFVLNHIIHHSPGRNFVNELNRYCFNHPHKEKVADFCEVVIQKHQSLSNGKKALCKGFPDLGSDVECECSPIDSKSKIIPNLETNVNSGGITCEVTNVEIHFEEQIPRLEEDTGFEEASTEETGFMCRINKPQARFSKMGSSNVHSSKTRPDPNHLGPMDKFVRKKRPLSEDESTFAGTTKRCKTTSSQVPNTSSSVSVLFISLVQRLH